MAAPLFVKSIHWILHRFGGTRKGFLRRCARMRISRVHGWVVHQTFGVITGLDPVKPGDDELEDRRYRSVARLTPSSSHP
jgi:hypothetical protein